MQRIADRLVRPFALALPRLVILGLAAISTSCASSKPAQSGGRGQAEHAANPPVGHPGVDGLAGLERYIVGTGIGATYELARQRAMVAIAGQIQGSLRAEGVVFAESERVDGRGRTSLVDREAVQERIVVETKLRRTEWIRVVSAAPKDDGVEVVALLDRDEASRGLREELRSQAEALAGRIAAWRGRSDRLAASREMPSLREAEREIRGSQELLQSLSRSPVPAPAALEDLREAEAELASWWRGTTWQICLGQDEGPAEIQLAGRLASEGWKALPCVDEPGEGRTLRLVGSLRATRQRMYQAGGYPHFCSLHLGYRVEGAGGIVVGGGSAVGLRSGGMSPAAACASSLGRLADELLRDLGAPSSPPPPRR